MTGFLREHSRPVAASVALHGALVAALLATTYLAQQQRPPTLQPLPIDAVVVDSRVLHAAQRAKEERVEQQMARARAAAEAEAAAAQRADAEARAAEAAKAVAANQAEEQRQSAANATQQAAAQRRADADADDKAAQAALAARRAAEAQALLDAKKTAAARQATEARQAAEARQADEARQAAVVEARRAADQRARQDRETELKRQLADEEHRDAVESGPLRDRYIAALRNRIQNAWIKPSSATSGIDCLVQVTQVPGGEVTGARVTQCNGDGAVRQSIENAVYRASPLPDPPDPALFERNITLRFRPDA